MSFIKCQLCDKTVNRNNNCEVCELHFKLFDTEAKVEKLRAGLKDISKYETCWTCAHYIGSTDKYCNPLKFCDINRNQFIPNEKTKRLALETLKEVFGE